MYTDINKYMNKEMGKGTGLPFSRAPASKCRRKDGNIKSQLV